ncbi:P-loop containing nucleoside triphosphate hydrolase protein [Mycena rosella]|uniref:Kinesin-like protein n=1 Tax=Mycena rosella TaxID=1033263 RepID=A0AAD7DRU5_MYCRO|nr:P-loop containing nucleoside triphosphate hydrolase protein [Mycena rosella]
MATAKVRIAARLRPRLAGEPTDDAVRIVHGEASCSNVSTSNPNTSGANTSAGSASGSGTFISVANPRDASQVFRFPFTSCYDAGSTQAELFEADVRPLVDVARGGVTVTIFAYGVTSSGKTHTMQGTRADPGVIPRVVEALFAAETDETTEVTVSYIEIYKDDVFDLLVVRENAPKLPVRENDVGAVFVAGLSSAPVRSVEEFDKVYSTATARRSVGATLLNRASSRSHAVLTLSLRVTSGTHVREGKINLVDLAGSENNKLTGNDPSRMAESAAINKSLSVLGQVVHALNTGAPRIPYRNAKLTRILQDALGGSSVGLLICNLAPGAKFRQDTLNTLNFAVRTKNIENKPVVNEREIRVPPPAPAPALVPLPKIDLAAKLAGPTTRAVGRPSLVPRPAARSSTFGLGAAPFANRLSVVGVGALKEKEKEKDEMLPGLSEAEIDARISRAVEAEVARRLAEREREMAMEAGSSRGKSKSPKKEAKTLPPGLSPLLKRHKDLDDQLQARLQELERKFERGNKEAALADVLSPVSKKKTGRAYVALARAHSDKGDLQVALDLYRRAEAYVPDNVKLKERIIEIEWAVKNGKAFKASPKRAKKKERKGKKVAEVLPDMDVDGRVEADGGAGEGEGEGEAHDSDDQMEVDEVETSLTGRAVFAFGAELTNTGSKRSFSVADGDAGMETPAKRPKRGAGKQRVVVIESDEEDEFEPAAAPRKSRRRIGGLA